METEEKEEAEAEDERERIVSAELIGCTIAGSRKSYRRGYRPWRGRDTSNYIPHTHTHTHTLIDEQSYRHAGLHQYHQLQQQQHQPLSDVCTSLCTQHTICRVCSCRETARRLVWYGIVEFNVPLDTV